MAGCSAIKTDGSRCRSIAATGSQWCPAHDPTHSEARKRAASKAARTRHSGSFASGEIAELKDALGTLYEEVREGTVKTGMGAILCQILNARIRLVETGVRVREQEELEERITTLERRNRGIA